MLGLDPAAGKIKQRKIDQTNPAMEMDKIHDYNLETINEIIHTDTSKENIIRF